MESAFAEIVKKSVRGAPFQNSRGGTLYGGRGDFSRGAGGRGG